MKHELYVISRPDQMAAFENLILPDIVPRLTEEAIFLMGAVEGNMPVGAAVMELQQGRAELMSIAVAKDRRRQGIAGALLRQCVRMLRRTSIQVLYATLPSANEAAGLLFSDFGMAPSDDCGSSYQFTLGALKNETLSGSYPSGITPLEKVSDTLFHPYIRKLFPSDPSLGNRDMFDPKISQVFVENHQITACLLAECTNEISISYLASQSREQLAPVYLMRGALAAAATVFPPDTTVRFTAFDESVVRLADKLLGDTAIKYPIRQWVAAGHRFRLIDTTPTKWEEQTCQIHHTSC